MSPFEGGLRGMIKIFHFVGRLWGVYICANVCKKGKIKKKMKKPMQFDAKRCNNFPRPLLVLYFHFLKIYKYPLSIASGFAKIR
jgi:hypothetical protein